LRLRVQRKESGKGLAIVYQVEKNTRADPQRENRPIAMITEVSRHAFRLTYSNNSTSIVQREISMGELEGYHKPYGPTHSPSSIHVLPWPHAGTSEEDDEDETAAFFAVA